MDRSFYTKLAIAILGAIVAILSQYFGSTPPDWVRLVTLICGSLTSIIAGLPAATQAIQKFKGVDTDGDGKPDEFVPDNGSSPPPPSNLRVGMFLFACLSLALMAGGCAQLAPKAYDPKTVGEVDQTVKFENQDYFLSKTALETCGAPAQILAELQIRHESELARLQAWKVAEEAKKLPESR